MFTNRPVAIDAANPRRHIHHTMREIVATKRSTRQEIEIIDLELYGPSLWLRDLNDKERIAWIQFAMLDEYQYHQLLVFLALLWHASPEEVLILGGGDWLVAWRALMRHGVKLVTIADWDKLVGEMVLKHIPAVRELGVHDDSRVDFSEEIDVTVYLPETPDRFFYCPEVHQAAFTLDPSIKSVLGV